MKRTLLTKRKTRMRTNQVSFNSLQGFTEHNSEQCHDNTNNVDVGHEKNQISPASV